VSIGLIVFIVGLFIGLIGIISSIFFNKFKVYLITISIIGLLFSFSSLLFLNIIPYTQNTFDTYKIEALKENIEYYSFKIKKYEEEDKKVLEEWAKQQEEMAKKLSAIGIQFAGEIQPNNIIKKLSEEIQIYFKIIDEKQLEIHNIKGEVKARKNHKWYWGF
jgi:hypothetical protein